MFERLIATYSDGFQQISRVICELQEYFLYRQVLSTTQASLGTYGSSPQRNLIDCLSGLDSISNREASDSEFVTTCIHAVRHVVGRLLVTSRMSR